MNTEINAPQLWLPRFPRPRTDDNNYDRGHAVIYGATELTGATRLAASACSKIGAGLVTVLAIQKADIYRMTLPADIMVRECKIGDLRHVSAILAGPGENGKS